MTQPILFPDAERLAIEAVVQGLAGRPEPYAADVFVDRREPATRRPRQVLIRRDGGPRLDAVREVARLTVRVYGRNDDEARDLARLVSALLAASATGATPVVLAAITGGPYPVEDRPGQPDYCLLTVELTVKGAPLS